MSYHWSGRGCCCTGPLGPLPGFLSVGSGRGSGRGSECSTSEWFTREWFTRQPSTPARPGGVGWGGRGAGEAFSTLHGASMEFHGALGFPGNHGGSADFALGCRRGWGWVVVPAGTEKS